MQVRVPIKAGPRTIGVAFVEKSEAMSPTLLRPLPLDARPGRFRGRAAARGRDGERSVLGRPAPATRRAAAAFSAAGLGDAWNGLERVEGAPSSRAGNDTACAKQILSALARLAYRRPVGDADLGPLLAFYETGRQNGNFDAGIQLALRAHARRIPSSCSGPNAIQPTRRPARRSASAISSWPRGCRSSSGAAFRTSQLLALASRGQAARPGGARAAGRGACCADPRAEALVEQLRRAVAVSPQSQERRARARTSFRTSTTTCARRFSARPSCSSRASCARTAACSIC